MYQDSDREAAHMAVGTEGFEAFFLRERRAVYGLAVVLMPTRSDAEEVTQDAFLAALRSWDRVETMADPGAWVRRVVANRAVSRFRRIGTETRWLARLRPGATVTRLDDEHSRIDVWAEVRRLPRRQAQVVALYYLHDLSRSEVAEILRLSEETVKTHLERARQTLASRLGSEED